MRITLADGPTVGVNFAESRQKRLLEAAEGSKAPTIAEAGGTVSTALQARRWRRRRPSSGTYPVPPIEPIRSAVTLSPAL